MDYIRYPRFSLILASSNLAVLSNNVQKYFLWEDIKLSLKYNYQLRKLMILEVKVQPKDKDHWCLWITGINTNSLIVSALKKKKKSAPYYFLLLSKSMFGITWHRALNHIKKMLISNFFLICMMLEMSKKET